jgi:hypothetical protein
MTRRKLASDALLLGLLLAPAGRHLLGTSLRP